MSNSINISIMTPKEKAKELREVFLMRQTGEQEQFIAEHQSLQCAIYHAENIIKELEKVLGKKDADLSFTYCFWMRVLEELNYNEELDSLGNIFDTVILLE